MLFRLHVSIVLALLCACSTQPVEKKSEPPVPPPAETAIPGSNHHLACLSDSANVVQEMLEAATSSEEGAILYFHGGLSGQEYMHETLGPWLETSLFATPELSGFYPIFVNYDAGLEWSLLLEPLDNFLKDRLGREALDAFQRAFPKGTPALKSAGPVRSAQTLASDYLKAAKPSASLLPEENKGGDSLADPDAYYVRILSDPRFASEVTERLIATPAKSGEKSYEKASPVISPFATSQGALAKYSEQQGASLKSFSGLEIKAGIAISRALARLALGSGHDIAPTFLEEVLTELGIRGLRPANIATDHWGKVKTHATQCFGSKSAGRQLVDGLFAWKAKHPKFQIHTISHSAGSIPTGRLLAYLKSRNWRLDSTQLIVPAINQGDFSDLFLRNRAAVDKLRLYVLDGAAESSDRLVYGIYPASLLYFVSGVAEGSWYNDRMLLIEQHLSNSRRPYRWWAYRTATRENPADVWDYFAEHRDELVYYQRDSDPFARAASHECTKYPWVAQGLGQHLVTTISGNKASPIPAPTYPDAHETAKRNCS